MRRDEERRAVRQRTQVYVFSFDSSLMWRLYRDRSEFWSGAGPGGRAFPRKVPPLVHIDPPSIVTASPMFYSRHRCRVERNPESGFEQPDFSLDCEGEVECSLRSSLRSETVLLLRRTR